MARANPRGRIYNFRLGLAAEWPRVFDLAAKLDKAVEIDCYPDRQDLNMKLVRLAKKSGCRISLGTDSHGPSQLRFVELGLASAVLAGVPQERILNFMGREELVGWRRGAEKLNDFERRFCPAPMCVGFSNRNERNFLLRIKTFLSNGERIWQSNAFRQGIIATI